MGREMTKERSIIFGHKNIFVLEGVQVIGVFSHLTIFHVISDLHASNKSCLESWSGVGRLEIEHL